MRLTTTRPLCRCGELATTFITSGTEGPFSMCGKHADEYGATFLAKARAAHHAIIGPIQHGEELWLSGCSCGRWERSATTEEACRNAHARHLEKKGFTATARTDGRTWTFKNDDGLWPRMD